MNQRVHGHHQQTERADQEDTETQRDFVDRGMYQAVKDAQHNIGPREVKIKPHPQAEHCTANGHRIKRRGLLKLVIVVVCLPLNLFRHHRPELCRSLPCFRTPFG